jgi:hypothetical protein
LSNDSALATVSFKSFVIDLEILSVIVTLSEIVLLVDLLKASELPTVSLIVNVKLCITTDGALNFGANGCALPNLAII